MKVRVRCLPSVQVIIFVAGVHWYDGRHGYYSDNVPVLVIAYQSGHVQLMRNAHDEGKIMLLFEKYWCQSNLLDLRFVI